MVLISASVVVSVLLAGPPLAACCWLLWRALGPSCRAAGAQAKRWLRRHPTGVWVGSAAVLSAVIAAIVVSGLRRPDDDLVEVLVVDKDLPVNTLLDESVMRSHIGRGSVRSDRLPAGAVGDERLVLGKTVLRNLRAGEYLSDIDVGHPSVDFIPDEYRALQVQLGPDDRSTDTVRPGDRVDLFVGVRVGGGKQTSEPVLKGLLVLAANKVDRVLTVAVTPAQAEAIRTAEDRGDLWAMRSGGAE
jgi:Flp pilus assembly protein CpaB